MIEIIGGVILVACIGYCIYTINSLQKDRTATTEEEMWLIENFGSSGYVSMAKLLEMSKAPPVPGETPEEIAAYKAFEVERDAKRALEKKALGFVETECPMCECKFLVRRVNDKHIKEE